MFCPKCNILPEVNSTSVFLLKCWQITNYASTWAY